MFCPEQGLEMATIIRFYAEILGATRKPRYESVLRANSWADDHNGRPEWSIKFARPDQWSLLLITSSNWICEIIVRVASSSSFCYHLFVQSHSEGHLHSV